MIKRWVYKGLPQEGDITNLCKDINVNPFLSSILLQRGVNSYEKAKTFFRPSLDQLHDPFLMQDMEKAVLRITKAMEGGEKILIYGDYDVDGTTSVALVYGYLSKIYPHMDYYIPDRYKEGYGISMAGIEFAAEEGFGLVISLDCGIKAVEKIQLAKEKGVDFIICDHHLPGDSLPAAHAVLDPKRKDCAYPYKELSGCGVGFKLLQALCIHQKWDEKGLLDYIDLVAVSIASDIVPITGENRILTHFGIQKLEKNPRPGLQALIDLAGLNATIDISSIVFGIGPRINAAGRIAHAKYAVKLLIAEKKTEAEELAIPINKNNTYRKGVDSSITTEALAMIEADLQLKEAKSTVLFKNDWHKGVIGIVASRCIEKYYRPTIILTESNNKATGSARSVMGFDVYEAILECSDLLEQFGGHKYAAGLTMSVDKVAAFKEKFEDVVAKNIKEEQLIPQLEIDHIIELKSINQKFYNVLKQMGPFGPGNMAPLFVSEDVYTTARPRILKSDHLKIIIEQDGGLSKMDAIGFGMAKYFPMISSGMRFKIAYCIEENVYKGNRSLQLILKDIKFE